MKNKGGDAKDIKRIDVETKFAWFSPFSLTFNVDKSGTFILTGGVNANNTYFTTNNVTFEINIEFKDIDGNEYYQKVNRLQTGHYIIEEPILK